MEATKWTDLKEFSKQNYLRRDIPVDDLLLNRESITLVLFDSVLTKSNTFNLSLMHLRTLNDYILLYTKKSLYLEYLMSKRKRNDHIIVILNNTETLHETHSCEQVHAILLMISNNDNDKNMINKQDYKKVVDIVEDERAMIDKLQQIIIDVEYQLAQGVGDVFSTFDRKERTLQDVRHEFALFMWRQAFKSLLKAMPYTLDARQELLDQCRSYYHGNHIQLNKIDEFEHNYSSNNVIRWYTKSCFLFRLLNKALRNQDIAGLYIFRYFIRDLCAALETNDIKQNITRVYRGGQMNRDEIENYSVGTLVAANGFLSTSRDLQVAHRFIGLDPITGKSPSRNREDEEQFVLFTINVDWSHSTDITLADISAQSDFPDEDEVLFDIGTTFEISELNYDIEHCLWHIDMHPSMEVAQYNREYQNYIRQRLTETKAALLFGILLTDMGEYEQASNYFQYLLTRMTDDEDRANAYYSAARIYRFTNQYDKALEFFQRAENLQRDNLPESNFDLARTLAGIASVYYELEDYQQELSYYKESMDIYQKILPENHIEIARTFNRLGFAYANQKQYSIALDYLSKSLIVYKHTVPDIHPDKALALHNTGLVHHVLGHTDQACDFYQKALNMREKALPPHHSYIAQSCYRLSLLYEEQDQYDSALKHASRALTIYEKNPVYNQKYIDEVQTLINRLQSKLTVQA